MPRAFDRRDPTADFDPTKVLEFDPLKALAQAAEMWQTIIGGIAEFAENLVKELIQRLLGLVTDPGQALEDLWDQLTGWTANIPVIGDIIALIGTLPLNAANLFGSIIHLLTNLPIGGISNTAPNLLPAPLFDLDAIGESSDWSIDPDKTRSGDGTGAAKLIANGSIHALRSGRSSSDMISVSTDQVISASIYVSHQGYVGGGTPIRFQVVPFIGSVEQEPVELDRYAPQESNSDWRELTGSYKVPEGVTGAQVRLLVSDAATAGTFWFDDASARQTGKIQQSWVDGLPEILQDLITRVQLTIDTVVNAIRGGVSTVLNTFEDLFDALRNISPASIAGLLGPENLLDTVKGIVDTIVGGLVGLPGVGAGLSDLFNVANEIATKAGLGSFSWDILGIRTNKPVDSGLVPSERSNFPLSNVTDWHEATQSNSLIGVDLIEESMPLGVVSWIGYGVSGITEFYVNIWKVNLTDGTFTLVHHSPNVVGILEGTAPPGAFIAYELAEPLPVVASEAYAYELVPVGGSHFVRGRTADLPNHPTSQIVALAATRNNSDPDNPPASIAKASVTRSGDVPWVSIAVDTGSGGDHHDPLRVYLGTAATTFPVPNWVNYIDPVGVGGGGGGAQGWALGINGQAGKPGLFNATTWVRGEHFGNNAIITLDPGAGGVGGSGDGSAGGATTISITTPDADTFTLTADGGELGTAEGFLSNPVGRGPGTFTYNDQQYVGGVDQRAMGGDGTSPGGGGNGGKGALISFQGGGNGAPGGGWLYFRPDALPDPDPVDLTPPTAPTLIEEVDSTFSSITITWSGATDDN